MYKKLFSCYFLTILCFWVQDLKKKNKKKIINKQPKESESQTVLN